MARPFSNDLRWKMIGTVRSGLSRRQTAELFKVGISCVIKLMQRVDATGDVAPARFGGFKTSPLARREADISSWIEGRSDITLAEFQTKLEASGKTSSLPALVRCLQRLGLTRKNTAIAAERSRDDVAEARRKWGEWQPSLTPGNLVFLDETWTSTNMAPRYGRVPKGQRVEGVAPHGHWKTTTFIAALRHDRITASCVLDGPINGAAFKAWTEQALAPTLQKGDVVILDNLASHKVAGVKEASEARGAARVYLPPYSLDLNPIEQVFAKLKHRLRKVAAHTVKALHHAIAEILNPFKPDECMNYIRNSGYST